MASDVDRYTAAKVYSPAIQFTALASGPGIQTRHRCIQGCCCMASFCCLYGSAAARSGCAVKGVSIMTTMAELAPYMRGWRGYFGFCETPEVLIALTRWVRLRLRSAVWRQWKTPRRRRAALIALGVSPRLASNTAGSGRGPSYLARSKA